jgi:hypothetical protein
MFSSECNSLVYVALLNSHSRSLPPLIVALVPGQQRSLNKLKTMRVQLSNEVAGLINNFGPELYEDFNEVCLHTKFPLFGIFHVMSVSLAFWSPLLVLHLRAEILDYGVEQAALVPWMHKD